MRNYQHLLELLNQELASEYHAMIAFMDYSTVLKRSSNPHIAMELERHAVEDCHHVNIISKQISRLGGKPCLPARCGKIRHVARA